MSPQRDITNDDLALLEARLPGLGTEYTKAAAKGDGLRFLAGNLTSALGFLDTAERRNEILASEMLIRGLDADPEIHAPHPEVTS